MSTQEEVTLLIKSKYPLIFYESTDEQYALDQLKEDARALGLVFFEWSLTGGLKRSDSDSVYYQTTDPAQMLKMIMSLIDPRGKQCGLYVLKDFDKHIEEPMVLRLFKDLLNRIRNTKDTIIMLAPEYKLPKGVESDAAHIRGGFPDAAETKALINSMVNELAGYGRPPLVFLSDDEENKIIHALKGLSMQQVRNVITQCVMDDNRLDITDLTAIERYKKKIFDNEGLLEFCASESKANIGNFDNLKFWLSERSTCFDRTSSSALPSPKGVLLMGVQGCGKSLAVKVIAHELKLPLYRLDIGRLYGPYIGQTEQNLRNALCIVEKLSPLCLWIDEIEKAFAHSDGPGDGGVSQRVLGLFLTWMQERESRCFIAATANDVYKLPPEFLRKGRFDESFFVDLPDSETRKALFHIHLKRRNLDPERFDCAALAAEADNFSGAEIEQAIIAALYSASNKGEEISADHIVQQIHATKPLAILKEEEINALRQWLKERARRA